MVAYGRFDSTFFTRAIKAWCFYCCLGCESYLEVKTKGSGGGGGDDDDDGDEDDGRKQKDVCKVPAASTWSPPVLDLLQTPSPKDPKIKFCKHKDVESCELEQARYSGFSQWHNVTNLSHTFWGVKDKKDILFKVRCQDADLANSTMYDF